MTDDQDPEWQVNDAGYHVNNKYGFGVLDTNALVNLATSPQWKTASEQHICREVKHVASKRIPPKGKFRSSTYSNGCIHKDSCVKKLEHVVVYVTLQHERRGTLEINLISPTGTKSKLLGLRKLDKSADGFTNWPFMTVFHWGENPQGIWTLEVDNKAEFSGTFRRWSLRLYGTCSHRNNRTSKDDQVCNKHCKKGCPEPLSKVCVGCMKYCDCTTGRCTARCSKGQETDLYRKHCTDSVSNQHKEKGQQLGGRKKPTGKSLPVYGRWLLLSAGIAITIGIIAGVWQGWLYYQTRKKLMQRRNQVELIPVHQYSKTAHGVYPADYQRICLTTI